MNHVINKLGEELMSSITWVMEYSSVLAVVAINCGPNWLEIYFQVRDS